MRGPLMPWPQWTSEMLADAACSPAFNEMLRRHIEEAVMAPKDSERERDMALIRHAEGLAQALREKWGLAEKRQRDTKDHPAKLTWHREKLNY